MTFLLSDFIFATLHLFLSFLLFALALTILLYSHITQDPCKQNLYQYNSAQRNHSTF